VRAQVSSPGQAGAPSTGQPSRNAIIRGRILAADTGRPLRRATVTIAARELGQQRTANTGLDGRYEFKDLPSGRYTITARRSGYLQLLHGQRRPLEQARPLQLGTSQTLENIDLTLPRAATVAGRVFDEAGEPIAEVMVQALRPAWVEGRRQLVIAAMTSFSGTDDTGAYRLSGLPPGRYYLRASTRETWAVVTNGVRGLAGFAPTFAPSTTAVNDARLVELGVGQRLDNADIHLATGRTANISGIAVDSRGQPHAARNVGLTERFLREFAGGGGSSAGSTLTGSDGSFVLRNVTPGEYQLSITSGSIQAGDGENARVNLVVNGANIDNLRLVTSAGWSASGRIITDDGSAPQMTRQGLRLGAMTVMQVAMAGAGAANIRDDWTFDVKSIFGPARLFLEVPDGWMVKSIRQGERDLHSRTLELPSGEQLTGIDIVVSQRVTRVTGQLLDARGAPSADGAVVVFADDPERWGDMSGFVRAARADQQGNYEIGGLPPGDYLAVALEYVQDLSWNDPEYLESLRRYAQRFTLPDGGTHALTLRIAQP
jgi:hypothetical protein